MSETRAWRDILGGHDPQAVEQLNAYLGYFAKDELLSPMVREFVITAAALAVRSRPSTVTHLKRARDAGASDDELFTVIGLAGIIGGMPALIDGLTILDELGAGDS